MPNLDRATLEYVIVMVDAKSETYYLEESTCNAISYKDDTNYYQGAYQKLDELKDELKDLLNETA